MKRFRKAWVAAMLGVVTLTGCAGNRNQRTQPEEHPLLYSESALDYESPNWGQPFWERWANEAKSTQAAEMPEELRYKVGIFVDPTSNGGDAAIASELIQALSADAARYGLLMVNPDILREEIARSGCSINQPKSCGPVLAIHPGIRGMLIVETDSAAADDTVLGVTSRLIDADFGMSYQGQRTTLRIQQDRLLEQGPALDAWRHRVLTATADHLTSVAPWFTHGFAISDDQNVIYLSAGRSSGLDVGTRLNIHEGGRTVSSPNGQVVGWDPGPVVGQVRVTRLLGEQMSAAELVSGRLPRPEDKLTLAEGAASPGGE